MARLSRFTQKLFGSGASANQIAEFGSLAAGTPARFSGSTITPTLIQSLGNYTNGWFNAVVGQNSPAIEDMNSLCYLYAYQLSYLMQAGIAEWDSGTTYYTNNNVSYLGVVYVSLIDSNTNNIPLSTPSDWAIVAGARKAPTLQTFLTGSGTYTLPSPAPLYLEVILVGGGGGGAGSGTSGGGPGGTGGTTTFGTSLLSATGGNGGNGGITNLLGGTGGTASLGSASGLALSGAQGGGATAYFNTTGVGGIGANSPLGGAGPAAGLISGSISSAGGSAIPNTGSGGGGGAINNNYNGDGGGAGGYINAFIGSPLSSYSYTVGALGTAGTAGITGTAGGSGGSGGIWVKEYYQ